MKGHFAEVGDFLREIYSLQDIGTLYGNICKGLGGLVSGSNVFIGEHDMENTLITGCVVRHMFETRDFINIVNSSAGQHPLWEPIREGGQIVRCISDYAARHQWENTLLYQEALGKEGVRDHISIEFGKRSKRIVSVGVFRSTRGFSGRDRETMKFLIPHIEQALNNARLMEAAGLAGVSPHDPEGKCVIFLDADARPDFLPNDVRGRLGRFFKDHRFLGNSLPASIERWVCRTKDQLDRGALESQPWPFTKVDREVALEIRMLRQRLAPGYVLVIRGHMTGAPSETGLTLREQEVLKWVRAGKSNDEIAIILDVAKTTVKTHLKHIFEKLGVSNRTAAAQFVAGPLA